MTLCLSSSQLRRYGQVLAPLLSELTAGEDIGWWLFDSGAAVTVLAKHCVVPYAAETVLGQRMTSSLRRPTVVVFQCLDVQSCQFSCACGTMMRIKMFGRKPD